MLHQEAEARVCFWPKLRARCNKNVHVKPRMPRIFSGSAVVINSRGVFIAYYQLRETISFNI